ncbi:LLM class flavin-dependent oxidoreductase [Cnuibacter physcomitrellae]|uniref:LLM class flavin-dependent oxidoreductase n=1 Tax=Cnuibacter physcomitrellae TaxID=1619308 RepID=UPI002175828B|nr:LLM class flavin-dependent oxidoreductase [Cnuibacter physcomitrellae]MCS5498264.1 LLM class flavin-dependent oxidoreductase [Cnuibacter physcomitrellae]
MSLKFWLHLPFFYPDLGTPYVDLLDETVAIVKHAEELGFEGVVVPENNFHNFIAIPSSLQMIAYLAPQTTTLKFQSGVLVLPQHHPMKLAGQVAFADHMTRGRLSLGVARGGGPYQAVRMGYRGEDMRDMYDESLMLLKRAWTEYDIAYDGRFWSFPETTVIPRLYQDDIPELWVAAQSRVGITNAGRQGINLLTAPNAPTFFTPFEELESTMGFYKEGAAEAGIQPGKVMAARWAYIGETVGDALKQAQAMHFHWSHYGAGAPERPGTTIEDLFRPRDDPRSGWKRTDRPIKGGVIDVSSVPPLDLDAIPEKAENALLLDPAGAIERFTHYESLGVTDVNMQMQFGEPIEDVFHSMELLSRYVFPEFE